MKAAALPPVFWRRWLLWVSAGVMVFGLALVFWPDFGLQGFSLILYGDRWHLTGYGADAVGYIALVHAVLGATMFGWGFAMWLVVRMLFARGDTVAWRILAMSLVAWFVPDTVYSLWSGFWPNAILNLVFIVLFAVPLAATRNGFRDARA